MKVFGAVGTERIISIDPKTVQILILCSQLKLDYTFIPTLNKSNRHVLN
jgi:hypothetical protein